MFRVRQYFPVRRDVDTGMNDLVRRRLVHRRRNSELIHWMPGSNTATRSVLLLHEALPMAVQIEQVDART